MQTIVELPEFLKKSDILLSSSERLSIINYLASHPAAGDIRKLRWSAQGKGKKANLTKTECNDLAKFTSLLIKNYGGRN